MSALRLGTRGSQLALWQARTVAGLLEQGGYDVELVIMKTAGDRLQDAPLTEAGGKRLFVKEIEDALLREEIDLAVHSAKDMSAVLPDGLDVAAVLAREDPRDALVLPHGSAAPTFDDLLERLGASSPSIGTSSVRRAAQLAALLPGATFEPIRGNVDTRLRKLDEGQFSALVLAAAGMRRLGFGSRISSAIPIERCIPAPGQGIVAIEIRSGDARTRAAVVPVTDPRAAVSLVAERTVVAVLGGGCQLPLGAIALHDDGGGLHMHAIVTSPDGRRVVKRQGHGSANEPEQLGRRLADELAHGGAIEILDDARAH
ncbi:MAG TPA: hydroxymethylbilane synthase [Egibacteraceae bacterium]|nr:hydroxymethylbilane synthase [Egibacteraceae bacterium]